MTNNAQIIWDGLWRNNAGLVQLLGLCPLLAVSNTLINGFTLGLASLVTLLGSNLLVSSVRKTIKAEIRIPVFILIIATLVTSIELCMRAWFYEMHLVLGIFIPLIVTNCAIIARAEAYASRNPVIPSIIDALATGLGFLLVLVVLGGMRELLGQGSLFSQAELLFGDSAKTWLIQFSSKPSGLLLMLLPPGAFFGLALLIAFKNQLNHKTAQSAAKRIQT